LKTEGGKKMNVYRRLRDLREDADKSQEEIAKIIGTSQSYYAQYENGKRAIPFDRIVVLAEYYNVSIDYIAGLIDTPKKIK
jgi:transcriptional regulator with XRE-family HTH domain